MPEVLDSLTPVGTDVPAGLEAACALPGVTAFTAVDDPEITLLVPADDEPDPEVTILIPAVNEQITVEDFVAWCHEGLRDAGVRRRDPHRRQLRRRAPPSSRSPAAPGCCTRPSAGLGRAYIDAIPYIRGQYVVMGDADCTYDFRKLAPFVEAMRERHRVRHGLALEGLASSRARCRALHQYFGTPFTTWILNRLYGSHFSDIHCGMRGITRDALRADGPRVPVVGVRLGDGAQVGADGAAHHRGAGHLPQGPRGPALATTSGRAGSRRSQAAWINLRAMFVHGAEFFLFKPGIVAARCSACC